MEGLAPNTVYEVEGQVVIGSPAGAGCVSAGGAPGESVVLKVGASATEPSTIRSSGAGPAGFVLNLDVGEQNLASHGPDGLSIGNLAVPEASCTGGTFYTKTLRLKPDELDARTDPGADLWLLVTNDSGFEGINRYYLEAAMFILTPR